MTVSQDSSIHNIIYKCRVEVQVPILLHFE